MPARHQTTTIQYVCSSVMLTTHNGMLDYICLKRLRRHTSQE
jgi:hypothetical protein